MPRRFLRRFIPTREWLHAHWSVRPFARWLGGPRVWSLQRRCVTGAFAAGLAICFVPLPVHIPLAVIVAVLVGLNLPVLVATVCLVNPLTVVPVYYTAYRVGAALLDLPVRRFQFEPSFAWLEHGLGPIWRPFLLGCLVCAIVAAATGGALLELLWRRGVQVRYRNRRVRTAAKSSP